MSKTKRLVQQLNQKEYNNLHKVLTDSEAKKSADLLSFFRADKLNDEEIKIKLGVKSNAYYTLRSRLNEKIESHILQEIASPRASILKQVASINEILFTKNRTIALASFKKLEKELKSYDLSNELTLVYRAMKKLMLHQPNYYEYSQLYNEHVAYMLVVDKVEDHLADYFKRYSEYSLTYSTEDDFTFEVIINEIQTITSHYQSHRLLVYQSLNEIFHELFSKNNDLATNLSLKNKLAEDFIVLENTFKSYKLDITYQNLFWVVKYLKILYYHKIDHQHRGISRLINEITENQDTLIANYGLFTFSGFYYNIKLMQYKNEGRLHELYNENRYGFDNLELNPNDKINYILYYCYLAIGCYHNHQYEEGLNYIQTTLKKVSLVNHIEIQIDIKLLECLFLLKLDYNENLSQTTNNIRRHIRLLGKDTCVYANELLRIFNSSLSQIDPIKKKNKIINYTESFNQSKRPLHSPIYSIYLNAKDFKVVSEQQLD